ncbi:MAG TPA: type II toxin-antitoxin system HicA family toxin [Synergistaceae bacterium]|nr:type II toxin-antitoxin system HicA family toxin [Synergistaceae bacterium]
MERIEGSHHHFKHSERDEIITVPHPRKNLKKGTEQKIRKLAGLL